MANEDMQIYIPSYESNASVRLVPLNSVKSMTEIEDPEDLPKRIAKVMHQICYLPVLKSWRLPLSVHILFPRQDPNAETV